MGWLFYHRPRGESDRDHFAAKMNKGCEILDSATVSNVFYAAMRDSHGSVLALVIMIRRQRGEYNFGYKDMDETMGPAYHDCPARILDLLTPTDSEWANQWRAECRREIARKAEARSSAGKVVSGTVITLSHPLTFGDNYGEADTFQLVVVHGGKRRWMANPGQPDQFLVRLPRDWARRYKWEIRRPS